MRITTVDDVAGAVRSARKELRWTQAHLAQKSGVSRDLINRLERGSSRAELAKVLDVLAALGLTASVDASRSPVDLAAVVRAHEEHT